MRDFKTDRVLSGTCSYSRVLVPGQWVLRQRRPSVVPTQVHDSIRRDFPFVRRADEACRICIEFTRGF